MSNQKKHINEDHSFEKELSFQLSQVKRVKAPDELFNEIEAEIHKEKKDTSLLKSKFLWAVAASILLTLNISIANNYNASSNTTLSEETEIMTNYNFYQ